MFTTSIFKYVLAVEEKQRVPMPLGAEILCVQTQGEKLCIWAKVNPDFSPKDRIIEVFGTGHPIPEEEGLFRKYIGTTQMLGGALVWHVFERLQ